MKSIDKLLKFLQVDNVADELTDEQCDKIADDVITGYDIDEDSRAVWLETNKKAMAIIKHCEGRDDDGVKDFPFEDSAKVVYPLLAPAVIQMSARICTHIVQNDQVCKFKVLGPDPDQQKEQLATRMTDFASYSFLIESKTWLKDTHKLCAIVSSWGTGFRQVYYDKVTKKVKDELLSPEDVIINHNINSLEEAPRVTVRHWMTKNNLIACSRAGIFCKLDPDDYDDISDERENADSRELNPVMEVLCQTTYLDLDEDGYAEPYKVYVLKSESELLGIYPAYKLEDLRIDPKTGAINYIHRRLDIVDYHLIDDPEGKFYSIGLNYLLTHINESISSILRELIDSGTLMNQQGGFITKAFKTQKKTLRFQMGEFQVLDCDSTVNPKDQIIPLPFHEPSQVLLGLLQLLLQGGKEVGMITDVLTGDVEGQNTPATTMLAMVEQGTRAFKPVIQKLYISQKNEFTAWFELTSEYLDVNDEGKKYALYNDQQIEMSKKDFDLKSMVIAPVADPTQCSEAHKYAKIKFLGDLLNTPAASALNVQAILTYMFSELQISNGKQFIAQPQPAQPDPIEMAKLQQASKEQQDKQVIEQLKIQLGQEKNTNEKMKILLQAKGVDIAQQNADTQQKLAGINSLNSMHDTLLKDKGLNIDHSNNKETTNAEHRKLDILEKQPRNPTSP